jgi:hypothetical protein
MGKGAICCCASCRYVVSFLRLRRASGDDTKTTSLMSEVAGRPKPAFGWRSAVLGS